MGLIVERKVGESVTAVIPPSTVERTIVMTVCRMSIRAKEVKLNLEADRDIILDRSEVHEAKQAQRKEAKEKASKAVQVPKTGN